MAPFAFVNATIYVGQFDLTTYVNNISGKHTVAQLNVTTFGSGGWNARIAGLHDIDCTVSGFNDYSTVIANVTGLDQNLYPLFAASNVVTISETDGTAGAPTEMFKGLMTSQPNDFALGEAAPFSFDLKGNSQWAPGQMSAARVSRTATGSAADVVLGSAAGKKLFVTRHIFAVSGNSPTLATFVESATNAAFLGATSRLSLTTATTVGSEWGNPYTGGTTDTHWRASWVIGGTGTPTFDFAVSFGLL